MSAPSQINYNGHTRRLARLASTSSGKGSKPVGEFSENCSDALQQRRWHVVSVNSKMEIETAARINNGGFIAHCPTFPKKIQRHHGHRYFSRVKIEPLFPSYLFVQEDSAFRKDLFETSKVRLMVFRKSLLTEGQMAVINSTALDLALASQRAPVGVKIKRGDVMQILHGAMQGEPVDVLEARRDRITVQLKRFSEARPVVINASSLARAV